MTDFSLHLNTIPKKEEFLCNLTGFDNIHLVIKLWPTSSTIKVRSVFKILSQCPKQKKNPVVLNKFTEEFKSTEALQKRERERERERSIIWISETKLDDFYHKRFPDYCLHLYRYLHNVLADMSSGLLQVFFELGNQHGTLNYVLYWIHGGHLF